MNEGIPVQSVAIKLEVHTNTLYRWIQEYEKHGERAFPGKGSHEFVRQNEVRRLEKEHKERYGSRRKYRRQQVENPMVQKNQVNQKFEVNGKNILWFGDITYIQTAEGTLYLSTYIDAYSRRVVGYQIENHMRDELVTKCLIATVKSERPKVPNIQGIVSLM